MDDTESYVTIIDKFSDNKLLWPSEYSRLYRLDDIVRVSLIDLFIIWFIVKSMGIPNFPQPITTCEYKHTKKALS